MQPLLPPPPCNTAGGAHASPHHRKQPHILGGQTPVGSPAAQTCPHDHSLQVNTGPLDPKFKSAPAQSRGIPWFPLPGTGLGGLSLSPLHGQEVTQAKLADAVCPGARLASASGRLPQGQAEHAWMGQPSRPACPPCSPWLLFQPVPEDHHGCPRCGDKAKRPHPLAVHPTRNQMAHKSCHHCLWLLAMPLSMEPPQPPHPQDSLQAPHSCADHSQGPECVALSTVPSQGSRSLTTPLSLVRDKRGLPRGAWVALRSQRVSCKARSRPAAAASSEPVPWSCPLRPESTSQAPGKHSWRCVVPSSATPHAPLCPGTPSISPSHQGPVSRGSAGRRDQQQQRGEPVSRG